MKTAWLQFSKFGILASIAYPAIGLLLWLTLIVHFRMGLGYWPNSINVEPNTPFFRLHAGIARFLLALGPAIVMTSLISTLMFLLHPRTRPVARYPALLTIACALGIGIMLLSPRSFLNWWLD